MTLVTRPFDAANCLKTSEDIMLHLEIVFEDGTAEEIATGLSTAARAMGRTDFQADDVSDISSVVRQLKSLGFGLTLKAA